MGLVVSSVPFSVVIVDVFPSVNGILSTEYHDEGTNDCDAGNNQVDPNPEMIAGSFHSVSSVFNQEQERGKNDVNNPLLI